MNFNINYFELRNALSLRGGALRRPFVFTQGRLRNPEVIATDTGLLRRFAPRNGRRFWSFVIYSNYKKIFLIFSFVIFIILAVFIRRAFSYNTNVAHPILTKKAIEEFNKTSENKISEKEINWIVQGAKDEDANPRWMNHFYNPIDNKGLYGFPTAKEWSRANIRQLAYLTENQTWQKAIKSYQEDKKQEAFIALGHILHLIEDMAVPAHTRADAHNPDPYEEWVKDNSEQGFDEINIVELNNLDKYFDELANYSNKYFFSKDTTNKYPDPKIDGSEIEMYNLRNFEYGYKLIDNKKVKIIKIIRPLAFLPQSKIEYIIDDPVIHKSYFDNLAPHAVSASAGVIELFFKEVKKEQEATWWDSKKLVIENTYDSAKETTANTYINVKDATISAYNVAKEAAVIVYDSAKETIISAGNKTASVFIEQSEQLTDLFSEIVKTGANIFTKSAKNTFGGSVIAINQENNQTIKTINQENPAENQEAGIKIIKQVERQEQELKNNLLAQTKEIEKLTDSAIKENNPTQNPIVEKNNSAEMEKGAEIAKIKYVIDGDTIELEDGRKVRYIGIDTPELNNAGSEDDECLAWAARERNKYLLENAKEIKLISDSGADKDKYGRLLRYVYANTLFVNKILANEGLAEIFICEKYMADCPLMADNVKISEIKEAGKEAENNKRGIYSEICKDQKTLSLINKEPEETNSNNQSPKINAPTEMRPSRFVFTTGEAQPENIQENTESKVQQDDTQNTTEENNNENILIQTGPSEISAYVTETDGDESDRATVAIEKVNGDGYLNVVINEIAWMGTSASADDKWIELYNNTGFTLNLIGWTLSAKDGNFSIELSGEIKPYGYYLLENMDDATISNITADQIYTEKPENMGKLLELRDDENNLIDRANYPLELHGIDNEDKTTMERINPLKAGDEDNWGANNGINKNGLDANENEISGTPRALNSNSEIAHTLADFPETINVDTTLTKEDGPYLLRSLATIEEGAALTIDAGVIIKADRNGGLMVKGKLNIEGTKKLPVVFTSLKDDVYAGDTNNSSDAPEAGDWSFITFISTGGSSVNNAIFRYGGYRWLGDRIVSWGSATQISESKVDIENSIFEYNSGYSPAVTYYEGLNSTFKNNIIRNNGKGIEVIEGGILLEGNIIENNNGNAVILKEDANAILKNNIIRNNRDDDDNHDVNAVYTKSPYFEIEGNELSGNDFDGIYLNIYLAEDVILPQGVYRIGSVIIEEDAVLEIQAGTIFKNDQSSYVDVYGSLIIKGEDDAKVIFTSFYDDSIAGDTNNDGDLTAPKDGDWHWITIESPYKSEFKNVIFQYGGYAQMQGYKEGQIRIKKGIVEISKCEFSEMKFTGSAIHIYNGVLELTDSNISGASNNSGSNYGVIIENEAEVLISNTNFSTDLEYGVMNRKQKTANAQNNWWGDPSGPYNESSNPQGLGIKVSDNVDFSNWKTGN